MEDLISVCYGELPSKLVGDADLIVRHLGDDKYHVLKARDDDTGNIVSFNCLRKYNSYGDGTTVVYIPYKKPEIKGYRDLSEEEIALMNEAKELSVKVGEFVTKLSASDVIGTPDADGIDLRWVAIGKTDLQTGFMALIRSIARPTTF